MTCLPKLENLDGSAEGGSARGTVEMVISTFSLKEKTPSGDFYKLVEIGPYSVSVLL